MKHVSKNARDLVIPSAVMSFYVSMEYRLYGNIIINMR